MILKNKSQEIFLVFTAEESDQGNVRPTLKFITNHEGGFGGSQSGLEQPHRNHRALCFCIKSSEPVPPPSPDLWKGHNFPPRLWGVLRALVTNLRPSSLFRTARAHILCFALSFQDLVWKAMFSLSLKEENGKEKWVFDWRFANLPRVQELLLLSR